MKHLDLCSGIGGFALAARWCGWETVAFCEIEPYCQKVLRKHWPDVPIHTDVHDFDGKGVHADVITCGYPCQPFSVAGRRNGQHDPRHIWPAIHRITREVNPGWFLAENVIGHLSLGIDQVAADLEAAGYEVGIVVLPAGAVGAWHKRERVWIVAHADSEGPPERPLNPGMAGEAYGGHQRQDPPIPDQWATRPDLVRAVHGIPNRVERVKALGNAIVPQVAYEIMRCMTVSGMRGDL